MSIADCPKCAHGNYLDEDVAFGNIECQECGEIFYWSRAKPKKYLRCQACEKVFNVNEMYSVDACSEDCHAAQQMREPDSSKAGVLSLPAVVKSESNLPA